MGLWSYVFGVDQANQQAADNATLKLIQLNYQDYQNGNITYDQWQAADARLRSNLNDSSLADTQIQQAFVDGAEQGLQNVGTAIQSGVNAAASGIQSATSWTFASIWKLIPWQIKVIAGLAVFIYLWSLIGFARPKGRKSL